MLGVLERYEKLGDNIKHNISIFIVSSSLNDGDKNQALRNQNVVDYLEKPLSCETITACSVTGSSDAFDPVTLPGLRKMI
ncbi:MAG: hypothetical protein V4553_05625 [Bacteroidota bacterium]